MTKEDSVENPVHLSVLGVKVRSIRRTGNEAVYCLCVNKNRTMVANGIVTGNCDALRYGLFSAFGKRFSMDLKTEPVQEQREWKSVRDYGFR